MLDVFKHKSSRLLLNQDELNYCAMGEMRRLTKPFDPKVAAQFVVTGAMLQPTSFLELGLFNMGRLSSQIDEVKASNGELRTVTEFLELGENLTFTSATEETYNQWEDVKNKAREYDSRLKDELSELIALRFSESPNSRRHYDYKISLLVNWIVDPCTKAAWLIKKEDVVRYGQMTDLLGDSKPENFDCPKAYELWRAMKDPDMLAKGRVLLQKALPEHEERVLSLLGQIRSAIASEESVEEVFVPFS